jgi:hypothetical protein
LTLGPSGHLLRSGTGDVQLLRYSPALAQHWKRDLETMARVKDAVAKRQPVEPLVRQMRHPKLLVRAVLALSVSDASSVFQECATAALEQCGYQQQPNQPAMTPGLAGRIATQDVTHLLWLSYLIRAYRLLEGTEALVEDR